MWEFIGAAWVTIWLGGLLSLIYVDRPVEAMLWERNMLWPAVIFFICGIPCACSCDVLHGDSGICAPPFNYRADVDIDITFLRCETVNATLTNSSGTYNVAEYQVQNLGNACASSILTTLLVATICVAIKCLHPGQHATALVTLMGILCIIRIAAVQNYLFLGFFVAGALFCWGSVAFLQFRRRAAILRAHGLVAEQKTRYDDIWEKHASEDAPGLQELEDTWLRIGSKIPGRRNIVQAASKLSDLYRQADAVNGWYQQLAQGWAAVLGRACAASCAYTPVKKPARTIEKCRRSYGGNCSRIADVVRSSVVCETFGEISTLLNVIDEDDSVEVVRGKQRWGKVACCDGV